MADPSRGVVLAVLLAWAEQHCVVPDGWDAGRPWRFVDWQLRVFAAHYTVRAEAQVPPGQPALEASAFVYRRTQIVLPQKAGKGPLTAVFVCGEAVGPVLFAGWARGGETYACRAHGCPCGWAYEYLPGEPMGLPWPTPDIQITGPSQDNTDNVYGHLRPMIDRGPLTAVIPRTTDEHIKLPGRGEIVPVTSSANTRLGNPITFAVQDEVGVWTRQNRMVNVAETQRRGLSGMKGRLVETTNAWDPAEQSVAQRTAESQSTDVYRFMPQAPAKLSYRNKAERARIHRHVYAGSRWIDLDVIEAEAAELLQVDPEQAERFYGNRVVIGRGAWMPDRLWEDTERADVVVPEGAAVCLGFDGSESDDWTAIRAETIGGHRFTPTYGPDRRPTVWKPQQWGGAIPRGEVRVAVEELHRRYRVARMYADPPGWDTDVDEWALRHGEGVVAWPTYRTAQMHEALRRSLTDLSSGASTHDADPDAALCVGNARRQAARGDRYLLTKPDLSRKIDVAMADVLAHEAAADARVAGWTDAPPPKQKLYRIR